MFTPDRGLIACIALILVFLSGSSSFCLQKSTSAIRQVREQHQHQSRDPFFPGAEGIKRNVDERFGLMPRFPKLIKFPHGITKVQLEKKGKFQGKEYRSIMKASSLPNGYIHCVFPLSSPPTPPLLSLFLPATCRCDDWLGFGRFDSSHCVLPGDVQSCESTPAYGGESG